ncbi:hypothetical protein B0H16DRAFT_1476488 [Mycena metata]|uniref:Bacteriophage T5 Orf172 DNA-binding domain-containing protein n=1 Tax=Mycena metata TaxID=1033252 RepID=A0AAD7HBE0_9AGAR|nr:hypothetical protein B0H16DRAFT_1476488 [Mycena metata]
MHWTTYYIIHGLMWAYIGLPCSAADGPGYVYMFFLEDEEGHIVVKIGESYQPWERKGQWDRKCWPDKHIWHPYALKVPERKKMEKMLHKWATYSGAWLGFVKCKYCGTWHKEKIYLDVCGGINEIFETAEYLATLNGWEYECYHVLTGFIHNSDGNGIYKLSPPPPKTYQICCKDIIFLDRLGVPNFKDLRQKARDDPVLRGYDELANNWVEELRKAIDFVDAKYYQQFYARSWGQAALDASIMSGPIGMRRAMDEIRAQEVQPSSEVN